MSPVRFPSEQDKQLTLSRLQSHARTRYIGKGGVKEIRGRFKSNALFLEAVKEARSGFVGRMFRIGSVKGIGKLARLEFQGPNKWKFFIYSYENQRYESYKPLREGTIEECLDAAAEVFLLK